MSKVKVKGRAKLQSMKKKLGKRASLLKQVKELEKLVRGLKVEVRMLAIETGKSLAVIEERSVITYKLAHGLISYLRENSLVGLTDEVLGSHIQKITDKWKADALEARKEKLTEGEAICENCHFLGEDDKFLSNDDIACPNCKETNIFFKPEEPKKVEAAS